MKNLKKVVLPIIAIFMLLLAACNTVNYILPESFDDGDQLLMPSEGELIAIFDTSFGEMRVRLFPGQAPKAVENFMKLAQRGYYNDITFHRILVDFIAQSGDPTGTGSGGTSIWGKGFEDEFDTNLYHYRGALSYARASKGAENEKNMSQFFFVTKNVKYYAVDVNKLINRGYSEKAANAYLEGKGDYTLDALYNRYDVDDSFVVFGQLYEGWDVLDKIAGVEVDGNQKPLEEIKLNKVTITTYTANEQ